MTLVDDPPAIAESLSDRPPATRTGSPCWRLAARLARRETIRRPGRTVLAGLLIAVPVFAMTVGSVLARTETNGWADQFARRYGSADIAVDPGWYAVAYSASGQPDEPEVSMPAGTSSIDFLSVSSAVIPATSRTAVTTWVLVTDLVVEDGGAGQPIEVVQGRAPRPGEVLLGKDAARILGVSIGDRLDLARPSGSWIVSGLGRYRDSYWNEPFVVPGFDRERIAADSRNVTTLYTLPEGTTIAETQQLATQLGGFTRHDDPFSDPFGSGIGRGIAWGWVAGVLALVAVGIIVAAAFATSARNQLVTIGQLSSNGATPRMIRRTLALQGTWTGMVGSLVGIGVGLAALPFIRPLAERVMAHDLPAYRFSLLDLVVIAVTATIAGTLAALVPARSASQIPVMSALAGRRPLGRPPRWLVPTGLALLAGGLGLIVIGGAGAEASAYGTDDLWALLIVLGVVGVVFGMVCATPLVVERVGAWGRGRSLSWRLALRSLARSRTRSAAVIAAIAVAVGGSVAAAAFVEVSIRESQNCCDPYLPDDTVVIEIYEDIGGVDGVEAIDASEPVAYDVAPLADRDLPPDTRVQLLSIFPAAEIVPLRVATLDPPSIDPRFYNGPWVDPNGPRIADPALLDLIGMSSNDRRMLDEVGAIRLDRSFGYAAGSDGTDPDVAADWQFVDTSGVITVSAAQAVDPSAYEFGSYGFLITEQHARQLGFDIVQRGVIVRNGAPLTLEQRDQLRELGLGDSGTPGDAFVEPGDPPRTNLGAEAGASAVWWNVSFDQPESRQLGSEIWIARLIVVAAAVLLSLLVVAIGLSLAAAEGRDERDVLTVVGATPASLRRQAAARAAVLAGTGIVLGVPTGFVPAWMLHRITVNDQAFTAESMRFPWLVVAALVLAVPTIVAGVAWSGSALAQRLRPASPTRRD